MDNVGIVVEDLPATIAFFRALGLGFEEQATIEGEWSGRVTGLSGQRIEIAMLRTPDGHSRVEIRQWLPTHLAGPGNQGWLEALEKLYATLLHIQAAATDAEV
jgi:catechol 2,3-dioxygenase-like lactoylglutathione lyase family enzyme